MKYYLDRKTGRIDILWNFEMDGFDLSLLVEVEKTNGVWFEVIKR